MAPQKPTCILTPKQEEANDLLGGDAKNICLVGGSRSGKTFLLVRAIFVRALRAARLTSPHRASQEEPRRRFDRTRHAAEGRRALLPRADVQARSERVVSHPTEQERDLARRSRR